MVKAIMTTRVNEMSVLKQLIEQAKSPNGLIGSVMLKMMNNAHSGMNKWALKKVHYNENPVILDIGAGGGKTIHTLSKMVTNGRIIGIDYSSQAVKVAIKANKKDVETGKVNIHQASVSNMPFQQNTFDLITAFQTHYFWPDIENDIKEVFRVLKQSGKFMIIAEKFKIHYHMTSFKTKADMQESLINVGFKKVEFFEENNRGWICVLGVK
jgi:ubiquinone/menaquinone biosynthesis C-methylase UbiE